MKIKGLNDVYKFIHTEIMPNQLKYALYLIGGFLALLLILKFMS